MNDKGFAMGKHVGAGQKHVGRRTVGRLGVAAAIAALALVVTGCGDDSDETSPATDAPAATATTGVASGTESGAAGASDEQVTIAVALTNTSAPYYQDARRGALAAGERDGKAKVVAQGPSNPTGAAMTQIVQNLQTSLSPDGFAANPCILEAWTRYLASLPRDVPGGNVLAYNCKPVGAPTETSPIKLFVGTNDIQTGVLAARAAVRAAKLGPETTGTALLGKCAEGVPILDQRQQGAVAETKRLLPKVEVVELTTDPQQGPNTAAWSSAVVKYEDIVLIVGACDQDGASLASLKARGAGGDFAMGSIEPSPRELQMIKAGKISAGVSTQPWVIANVATRLLIDGARGVELPEGWLDTGFLEITEENAADLIDAAKSPEAGVQYFTPVADAILNDLEGRTRPMADAFEG